LKLGCLPRLTDVAPVYVLLPLSVIRLAVLPERFVLVTAPTGGAAVNWTVVAGVTVPGVIVLLTTVIVAGSLDRPKKVML
jgi:hypothetical protein